MAAPVATNVYRNHGKLYINPTDLSDSDNDYGGTPLGTMAKIIFSPGISAAPIRAEEYGGQAVDAVLMQRDVLISALVRSWDDDILTTLFPNTTTGSSGEVIELPGTNLAGRLLAQDAVKLLFVAARSTVAPSIILYRAIPVLDPVSQMRLSITREMTFPCQFLGVRDGSSPKKVGQMGVLSDLSVS